MTALSAYTFVNTATTVQYFDRFSQLTIAGNGGFDVGVMYDSSGNDTWTASDGLATFAGASFRNIATGYDQIYAFQYFGGRDTATITGSSGNDKLRELTITRCSSPRPACCKPRLHDRHRQCGDRNRHCHRY